MRRYNVRHTLGLVCVTVVMWSLRRGYRFRQLQHPNDMVCGSALRADHLRQACAKQSFNVSDGTLPNLQVSSKYSFILTDDVHKVLYCAIPKAASTTWKMLFAVGTQHVLTSSMSEHQVENDHFMRRIGLRYLSWYSSAEISAKLASYRKLLVVRHPLTRLVSAYADKIARFNSYGAPIRRKIVAMTSPSDVNSFRVFQPITFSQFIRYVVKENENGNAADHHWMTYTDLCNVCEINYDHIVKVETMSADAERLLPQLFQKDAAQTLLDRLRVTWTELQGTRRHGRPHQSVLPSLNAWRRRLRTGDRLETGCSEHLPVYKEVSREDLVKLLHMYENDMDWFGYAWSESTLTAKCCTVDVIHLITTRPSRPTRHN